MNQTLYTLLSLDYLILTLLAYTSIENFDLDRLASPIRIYYPLYSEIFAFESILVYLIIAGAILAQWAEKETPVEEVWRFPGRLAMLFAILAVPARLMTNGLIFYDTSFFAFVMFFSLIMSVCSTRFLLTGDKTSSKHLLAIVVAILITFLVYQPWNSPSLKLKNAILAGNSDRFQRLAASYPLHLRLHSGLLNIACKKPDFEIIKKILDSGNTSFDPGYTQVEIFAPQHLEILEYMHAHGVKLAQYEVLRSAVAYYAHESKPERPESGTIVLDKTYPVLKLLIRILEQAPDEDKKQKSSWSSGYTNLLSTAAASGDTDLMNFLLQNGFVIDEEVIRSLVVNKHFDKPEIQALITRAGTVVTRPTEPAAAATATASQPAAVTVEEFPAASTVTAAANANSGSATLAATNTLSAQPLSLASGLADAGHPATIPDTSRPAPSTVTASTAVSGPAVLQPAADGLDLLISCGADVKDMRLSGENIIHFIARYWRSIKSEQTYYKLNYPALFAGALGRKVDLNQKNRTGQTPLWVALENNNFRAFSRLLDAGADYGIKDQEGQTMLEYCRKNGRNILLSLLKETNDEK